MQCCLKCLLHRMLVTNDEREQGTVAAVFLKTVVSCIFRVLGGTVVVLAGI